MRALLVIFSAAVASVVARPGQLAAGQPPVADPATSKEPTARTSNDREADVDDTSLAQVAKSLQNPVPDSLEASKPANPTPSGRISEGPNGSTGIRFVDNPHIGLPFGTVLPLAGQASPTRASPTASTLKTFRRDSPHVGLPPFIPTLDSPASTATDSSPTTIPQTETSPYGAFGNSNNPAGVPSKNVDDRNPSINTRPLYVNRREIYFGGLSKIQIAKCVNPRFSKVSSPNSPPTHKTYVFFPVGSPMPHVTNSAGLHARRDSTTLSTNDENSNFLVSNTFGGFFTKSADSKFSYTPSPISNPTSSPSNLFQSFSVNSGTRNGPSHDPVNTKSFVFPSSSPTALSSGNRGSLFLFSEKPPHGNVKNAQRPVLVGGPFNMTVFPKQPSLDDISQVMASQTAPTAPTAPAAGGPGFSLAADTTV